MHSTEAPQPILIIAGMHRSGTSLAASLLQDAGLNIGQNFLQADSRNPKGFFENIDFLTFHEQVFFSLGISTGGWTSQPNLSVPEHFELEARDLIQKNASHTQPWGWKEPRTTLFLNFWSKLLPAAKFLLLYRDPWEVVDSLYRRGDETFRHHPEFALQMWMSYNQRILEASQTFPERCLIVHLSAITYHFSAVIEAIQKKWGIELHSSCTERYDPSLLQNRLDHQRMALIKHHFPDAFKLYCNLNTIADFPAPVEEDPDGIVSSSKSWILQDWSDLRHLDREYRERLQQEQHKLQGENESLVQSTQGLNAELERSHAELYAKQAELERLHAELYGKQAKLEQLQGVLVYSQSQFLQTHSEIQAQRERSHSAQTQIKDLAARLRHRREKFQQKQAELKDCQSRVTAMETSKFWKMRKGWFKLKRLLGLPIKE